MINHNTVIIWDTLRDKLFIKKMDDKTFVTEVLKEADIPPGCTIKEFNQLVENLIQPKP